ncbi:MAG: arginase [Candidatus Thorarchaeota archaeon]
MRDSGDKRTHLYILGIATDLGLCVKGADLAPRVLRRHFELDKRLEEMGIVIPALEEEDPIIKDDVQRAILDDEASKEEKLYPVKRLCERAACRIQNDLDLIKQKYSPYKALFLGGDHSIAMGSYAGVANHLGDELGVLWIDAHGDYHTWRTSVSKNVHGMALAAIVGEGIGPGQTDIELFNCCPTNFKPHPHNVFMLGVRDLEASEKERLGKSGVKIYTASDIEGVGVSSILTEICRRLRKNGINNLHVSLDLDVVDPIFAPGTSTPVNGGLTFRELIYIAEFLANEDIIFSLDVVEYNITNDICGRTANLAKEAILHFIGKTHYPQSVLRDSAQLVAR